MENESLSGEMYSATFEQSGYSVTLNRRQAQSQVQAIEIYGTKNSKLQHHLRATNLVRSSGINMSASTFLNEISSSERAALISTLDQIITDSLKSGRPVLLEGFGVLVLCESKQCKTYNLGNLSALRTEQIISYDFEKCEHYEGDYADRFPDLVKTAELAKLCRASIEPEYSLLWSEPQLTRIIRGLFKYVRQQLVQRGHFSDFKTLGCFTALHNRQGNSESDWFAGADVLLINNNQSTISASDPLWFERPILQDSWELLIAAYGEPLSTLKIELETELGLLGYDLSDLPGDKNTKPGIELAVFQTPGNTTPASASDPRLLFCTRNLIDSLPLQSRPSTATEFTWSVQIEGQLNEKNWETCIGFGRRVFTLGWILLVSAKHKQLPIGAGIASNLADAISTETSRACHLQALLTTLFKPFAREALTAAGPFQYLSLLPISKSEYEIAEKMSASYLLELLDRRGLAQTTRLYRKPINLHLSDPSEETLR